MVGRGRLLGAAWGLSLLLAACGGGEKPEAVNPNVYPKDYKAALLRFLPGYRDPTGIRNAYLAAPVLKEIGSQSRYVACLRFEAPDGGHEYAAVFFAETLNQFVEATPQLCGGAAYQSFPELQALKRIGDGK